MSENLIFDDLDESYGLVDLDAKEEEQFRQLQHTLLARCKSANIDVELKDDIISVGFPNGREKRWISFITISALKDILDIEFEKYIFLGDFVAIASFSTSYIEAIFRSIDNRTPKILLYQKMFRSLSANVPIVIEQEYMGRDIAIELGNRSKEIGILSGDMLTQNDTLSLKITGIGISQHNKSVDVLRKISDSLFFQFDLEEGIALNLIRNQRHTRKRIPRRINLEKKKLEFPKIEFDEAPSSLYWYARGAQGIPLLQFLAFYQVIEYYYPTYSQEEARRRIRTILKDPTFRTDRDADIGKVLSTISGHGRGFGDERSQLRATINACVDANDLRVFLTEDTERASFFSSKQKGLTDHKLPLSNKDTDFRAPVADLIYDIRCKIVHTKGENSDGEVELLLPFSKEAELLFYDIELMQYIARKVLIAASAPLNL